MAILQVANVLLLLASLFSLPALHAVDFQYCNEIFSTDGDIGYKYGNISRVEIYPNPVGPQDDLAFWILGSSNSESSRIEIGLVSVRDADGPLRLYTFEETGVGPAGSTIIEPGTTFALTLLKVPHRRPEVTLPTL
ncbi:unnamed protein product [Microthlaspi erraticum]|uniref:Uncharacterized protein n=1 Tax=Microthlaspi erraticum TaxID=1685480 RepID=A0A6D2HB76_9BRAS|nr:unnamed protein product [Microthlaspi erraticum]